VGELKMITKYNSPLPQNCATVHRTLQTEI